MIEIELFWKIVENKIREEHEDNLIVLNRLIRHNKIKRKDKYLRGYNKGVADTLHILYREYKAYYRRLKKEEKAERKF